jgi:hypothetical protein
MALGRPAFLVKRSGVIWCGVSPSELSLVLQPLIEAVKHSSDEGIYDWIIGGLTALSLLLVAWSTVLTRRMQAASEKQAQAALKSLTEAEQQRKIAEQMLEEGRRQHTLEVRPVVALRCYQERDHGWVVLVHNAGRGPAFGVEVSPMESLDNASLDFATIQMLAANAETTIPFSLHSWSRWENGERMDVWTGDLKDIAKVVRAQRLPSRVSLLINYSDLYNNGHTTYMDLKVDQNGRFGLHYIGTVASVP